MDNHRHPYEPMKVEFHKDYWEILEITDVNGRTLQYLMTAKGTLRLGQVYLTVHRKFTVHLFMPEPGGQFPIVLRVEDHS